MGTGGGNIYQDHDLWFLTNGGYRNRTDDRL